MEDLCSICLSNNDNDVHLTLCGHRFHIDCFKNHLKSTGHNRKLFCPNCRFLLDKSLILEGCCVICTDNIFADIKVGNCGHHFHIGCYNRSRRYSFADSSLSDGICPVCIPSIIRQHSINDLILRHMIVNNRIKKDPKESRRSKKREKEIHSINREKFFPKSRNSLST